MQSPSAISPGMKKYFMMATVLGAVLLIADIWNAVTFGLSVGGSGPFIYGGIALASGVLLVIAAYFWLSRAANPLYKPIVFAILSVYPAIFCLNVWSQIGVVSADRMSDVQHASLQDEKRADVVKERDDAEDRLKVFNAQLAKLMEMQPWVATVKAEALREKIATLDKSISEEGDKRNGGCKRKCLDLMAQKTKVEEQVAAAEQRQNIEGQIAATQKVLNDARAKLAKTEAGESKTRNASRIYASLINWSLSGKANESQVEVANNGTGIVTALVLCMAAATMTLVSALPHLAEALPGGGGIGGSIVPRDSHLATAQNQQSSSDGILVVEHHHEHKDDRVRQALRKALAVNAPHLLKAA